MRLSGVYRKRIALLGAVGLTLALPISCARNTLQGLDRAFLAEATQDGVKVNFCTDRADTVNSRLKYVVILDHSGSNQLNYRMAADGSGAPALNNGVPDVSTSYGTDPLGKTRYGDIATAGTLLNFLYTAPVNNPLNPMRWYALVDFNDQVRTYPINSSGFTADTTAFYNYVQSDAGGLNPHNPPQDSGATSYLSALGAANTIIQNDVKNAESCAKLAVGSASPGTWCPTPGLQISSTYIIVFMSDGAPILQLNGLVKDSNGNIFANGPLQVVKEASNEILGQVAAILGMQSNTRFVDSINLFTIYYYGAGNPDLSGQKLLHDMATVGNGVSYDALSNSNIDYSRFTPPSRVVKYTLADIFVTNTSVTWWSDGQQHLDSDGDGLPDDVELQIGSDPYNPDSDGNGISDFVEYQINSKKPCRTLDNKGHCSVQGALNYASSTCTGLKTQLAPKYSGARPINGAIQFLDSDHDGLNDCEEALLNNIGGSSNPDSNGDMIPDWLEFKNTIPFQLGSAPAVTSPSLDGMSIYDKIKSSLPANIPMYQLVNPQPANYDLALASTKGSQDCYNLVITGLPVIGPNNAVRVDVIEKSPLLQDRVIYHVGKKSFNGNSKWLEFNDWNDSTEQTNGTWSAWP